MQINNSHHFKEAHHGEQTLTDIHIGGDHVDTYVFRKSTACEGYITEWAIEGGLVGVLTHFIQRVLGMADRHRIKVGDIFIRYRQNHTTCGECNKMLHS